jgi:hypothetical protein
MRFEVPQFIEVEDKIVGPLTWKQFVYLAGGTGVLVALYLTVPMIIFALVGIPIGALAGFLAFHKVNNRPFSLFLESAVNYFGKSRLYLWKKEESQSVITHTESMPTGQPIVGDRKRLTSLAEKLEFYSLEK